MTSFIDEIRRLLYGPPLQDTDTRFDQADKKVEKLAQVVHALDDRVAEIERSHDPWRELMRVLDDKQRPNDSRHG